MQRQAFAKTLFDKLVFVYPPTQLSSMQDQPVSPPSLPFFVHLLTFLLLLLLLLLGSAVALEVLLVHCVSFE